MPRFIIVGQGIAGSLLSYFLWKEGEDFLVYDEGLSNSSSAAAGGILNPITGKLFAKSWLADELFPFAKNIYKEIEKEYGISFYSETHVAKVLQSVKEQNDFSARAHDENYADCFPSKDIFFLDEKKVQNPFGCFAINGARVSAKLFLESHRNFLKKNNFLKEERFDFTAVTNHDSTIIFCDGHAAKNPAHPFHFMPWQLAKGEYLLVRIPGFYEDKIVKGATTISPTEENGIFYAGATYQWAFDDVNPTEEKRNEIIASLQKTISCNFEIVHHGAGIRPAVKDRRPFIGAHPTQKNVYIFNGFGTKGFSMAPYFAEEFCRHLLEAKMLNEEVRVGRFY